MPMLCRDLARVGLLLANGGSTPTVTGTVTVALTITVTMPLTLTLTITRLVGEQ
jgi:glutaminase